MYLRAKRQTDVALTEWTKTRICCNNGFYFLALGWDLFSCFSFFSLTCFIVIIDFDNRWLEVPYWDILQNREGEAECLICYLKGQVGVMKSLESPSSLSKLYSFLLSDSHALVSFRWANIYGWQDGFHMQLWKHFTVNKIPQIFS